MTAAAAPNLTYRKDGGIAWITLDNPARLNAMTAAMWEALPGLVTRAVLDGEVRTIVVRGAGGKAFCAGADISEFETVRTAENAAHYDGLNEAAFQALLSCPKPVIAMIHGFCMGGGLAIALCCDMRLADDASQFAVPAAKLGIGYNARWVRPIINAVPPARAKELLFTGRRFRADEAAAMGLVNRVLAAGELETAVKALGEEISANAPLTVAAAKLVIDEIVRHPEAPDMAKLDAAVDACFRSEDYIEGRRAFIEKRKADFKGK